MPRPLTDDEDDPAVQAERDAGMVHSCLTCGAEPTPGGGPETVEHFDWCTGPVKHDG